MSNSLPPFRPILVFLLLGWQLVLSLPAAGLVETAGYTTRDRQIYGPALLRIVNDTLYGVHIVWKDEPSRVIYNFKSYSTGSFNWQNGTNVFTERVTLGNIDVNPRNHCLNVVGNFFDNQYIPVFAQDRAPGLGNFRETIQRSGFKWNVLATTAYGYPRFFCQKVDTLYYRTLYDGRRIGYYSPYPTHNLTAAHDTIKLAAVWTATVPPFAGVMFLRHSRNGGEFWFDTLAISRSVPSEFKNTFLGGYCLFDAQRKIHVVANTYNGSNLYQVELWHCLKDSPPVWSRICSVGTNHPQPIGFDALFAGRLSLGQNPRTADIFVCWEQFDSLNLEPSTGLARAEIWASHSADNGRTWGEPICLTTPDNTSKRFPCLAPVVNDTLHITYLVDSVAGFWEMNQGPRTTNPIIYHRVPADSVPVGMSESNEDSTPNHQNLNFTCTPNPFYGKVNIKYSNPSALGFVVNIYDASGKLVASYRPPKTSWNFVWNGQDNNHRAVKPGIYFCEIVDQRTKAIKKLIKVR